MYDLEGSVQCLFVGVIGGLRIPCIGKMFESIRRETLQKSAKTIHQIYGGEHVFLFPRGLHDVEHSRFDCFRHETVRERDVPIAIGCSGAKPATRLQDTIQFARSLCRIDDMLESDVGHDDIDRRIAYRQWIFRVEHISFIESRVLHYGLIAIDSDDPGDSRLKIANGTSIFAGILHVPDTTSGTIVEQDRLLFQQGINPFVERLRHQF